jgi:hypothetical protein
MSALKVLSAPADDRLARVAELRAAGLVHRASDRRETEIDQVLPVAPALRALLPSAGLRRGGTVAIGGADHASGATSLLFALLAQPSAAGSWCAAVGLPELGLVAAAEAGVAVDRLALVPHPGPDWAGVVAALLDGVDIVAVGASGPVPAQVAGRLGARARQRGVVLVPMVLGPRGQWPGADLTLEVVASVWSGLDEGRGRLRQREMQVRSYGRGAAARPRRTHIWLGSDAVPTTITEPTSVVEPTRRVA